MTGARTHLVTCDGLRYEVRERPGAEMRWEARRFPGGNWSTPARSIAFALIRAADPFADPTVFADDAMKAERELASR